MFEGTGADILVECMARAGITTIFGVPGDTGVSLYDALARTSGHVSHVLANDERGAAFMADAYARRTNGLGVVEVSSGGGVTFVIGGLGEAYAASIPVLIVTSDISRVSRGTGALTEIDQIQLFKAVTKWQGRAESVAEIPVLFEQAVKAALSDRPAPVVLIVPEDLLDERAESRIPNVLCQLPLERSPAPTHLVEGVAKGLMRAKRPAIVAGSGVHLSGAYDELESLAALVGIPVASTIHGIGALSGSSDWHLGVVGANGGRDYANQYVAEADHVLFVGTRANSTDTNGFRSPTRRGPEVAQIDIAPERAGRNYPGSVGLVGDARTVLGQLIEALGDTDQSLREARKDWIVQHRRAWQSAQKARLHKRGLDPAEIVRVLAQTDARKFTVISDCGTPTPYFASLWECERPGRRLLLSRGHGPMGYAFPGAVGAAMARPNEPVIAVVTDGSLLMAVGALDTVARCKLPITYVHLNNGTLGWIKALQHFYFGQRYFSTDISRFDAVAIARGFGLEARRIHDLADFQDAVTAAIASRRPSFIDVPIPDEYELVPPVASWLEATSNAHDSERPIY